MLIAVTYLLPKMNSKEILDNCNGYVVIKEYNVSCAMCQFLFIIVLKLKSMINQN